MHESVDYNKEILDALRHQNELLEKMYDAQMSMFVQITRLYDVFAASATGASEEDVVALLGNHEQGLIDTAPPVIREFGQAVVEDEKNGN